MIDVTGLSEAKRGLARVLNFTRKGDKAIMAVLGKVAIYYIIRRTAEGEDVDGAKFEPYSADYARRKGVPRSNVNLAVTRKMIGGIAKQAFPKKARIYVRSSARGMKLSNYNLAVVHNYGAHTGKAYIPKREFMGLTDREVEILRGVLQKIFYAKVKKLFMA